MLLVVGVWGKRLHKRCGSQRPFKMNLSSVFEAEDLNASETVIYPHTCKIKR